jgi:cytochrome c oxidase cbb3-type subunit 2
LIHTKLPFAHIADNLKALRAVGVPYSDEAVENARFDVMAQVDPDSDGYDALLERYPRAQIRNFDGRAEITELDALIAYLQMLGTLVDFSTFEVDASR